MPDSSPPPVPSPTPTPARTRTMPVDYCTTCHWPLRCSNAECPTAPSAPPAPAPASELDEMERLAREARRHWPTAEWPNAADPVLDNFWVREWAEFIAFCTPERVAQLVAAARRGMEDAKHLRWIEENAGAELRIDRDGDDVEVCRWHRKYVSYHHWFGRDIREALSVARASRPTEETDGH